MEVVPFDEVVTVRLPGVLVGQPRLVTDPFHDWVVGMDAV